MLIMYCINHANNNARKKKKNKKNKNKKKFFTMINKETVIIRTINKTELKSDVLRIIILSPLS